MQLLSLCFYHCARNTQIVGYWHHCSPFPARTGTADHPLAPVSTGTVSPISACFLLRSQMKVHQQRPLEQAKKAARILQPPAGIFPWGRRETSVQSQGWSAGGSEGGGRLRLGGLSAVPDTAASPTLTQTLRPESLGGGCQGGTSHPCPFQSSLSQTGHTYISIALVNSTCEIPCGLKEPICPV